RAAGSAGRPRRGRATNPGSGDNRLPTHCERHRVQLPSARQYPSRRATNLRPEWVELGDNPVAEVVARAREREGDVGMQALEAACAGARAADPKVELRPDATLFVVRTFEARMEFGILRSRMRPAFDAARGLEPRDDSDEVRARQPEGGRERVAGLVERRLLSHGRTAERAADDDAPECTRRPAQLTLDGGAIAFIVHCRRS